MAYRNKIYVALDYDEDCKYYNMMKAWKQNDNSDFDFHNAHEINNLMTWSLEETVKNKLKERFRNSKMFILLVGEKTKFKYKYVRWEIEQALKRDIPIIVVNLNKYDGFDSDLCPPILHNELALHIGFSQKDLIKSLEFWERQYKELKRNGNSSPMRLMR